MLTVWKPIRSAVIDNDVTRRVEHPEPSKVAAPNTCHKEDGTRNQYHKHDDKVVMLPII